MSSIIFNPSMQDVIYNGNSCSLYFNGSKIWPSQPPVIQRLTIDLNNARSGSEVTESFQSQT